MFLGLAENASEQVGMSQINQSIIQFVGQLWYVGGYTVTCVSSWVGMSVELGNVGQL